MDVKFKNEEILSFFTALTLVLTPLARLLTVLADFIEALMKIIPQISLTLSSLSSLNNSIVGSLIGPVRDLIMRTDNTFRYMRVAIIIIVKKLICPYEKWFKKECTK